MKLTAILLLSAALQLSAKGHTQNITLKVKDKPLQEVFAELQKQSGYNFVYTGQVLENAGTVTIDIKNVNLEEAIKLCLKSKPLTYTIIDKIVVIKPVIPRSDEGVIASEAKQPAPPIDIKGRITNDDGDPVVASIIVKGTTQGTTSNPDGSFSLSNVDENATLSISAISIIPFEVKAATIATLMASSGGIATLTAKIKVSSLNEVIVNKGYYTEKQKLSTSNVTTITSKDIQNQPVNNPLLALQGRVPGLFITQTTGMPGSGVSVRIQGQNSLTKGSDPFYVIDGIPYTSQLLSTSLGSMLGNSGTNGGQFGNPLNFINPSDIERIDILKDADATAIYGSRAANGAILITTKKGKAGKTKVDINIQNGWGKMVRRLDLLNTEQYLQMRKEAISNDGLSISATDFDVNGTWDTLRYTDWQNELLGSTANYFDLHTSISGGNTLTQFLVTGAYHKETTVFPGNFSDQKGSLHFNLNHTATNQKFRFQFSGNYLIDNSNLFNADLTSNAMTLAPDAPPLYVNNDLNWAKDPLSGISTWENPLSFQLQKYKNKASNLVSNASLSYVITPKLELKSTLGYNNFRSNELTTNPLISFLPEDRATSSRVAGYSSNNIESWIIEPQATFKTNIRKAKLEALIGFTITNETRSGQKIAGSGYNSDLVLGDIKSASSVSIDATIENIYKYNAIFGRINYNSQDKYIVNLTARRDGSSRFGVENQFHNFGSIAAGWIFSNELLMQKNFKFLSFGKFRASYGTSGNDQIGDYQFLSLYSPISVTAPYQGATGIFPTGLVNPFLEWEETTKLQFGLDLGFIQDRIFLSTNYYRNRSSNQLLSYSLSIVSGFGAITKNFPATVQNTGWEFLLNTINLKSDKLSWSTKINLSIPRNKLIEFPDLSTSTYASSLEVGKPITVFKAFDFAGVDQATGVYQFYDKNGNITATPNSATDKTVFINTSPEYYGGIQNDFSYKNIEISFLFQFVKQVGTNYLFGNIPGYLNVNQPISVLNRWQKPGDMTGIQKYDSDASLYSSFINAKILSNASYSDASYIRLKNISLAWQLPDKWKQKAHLQNAKIYIQAQNLLTVTKYLGLDPETRSSITLPPLKVVTLGAQFTF